MAREESNREDLLREATALVQRIEFAPRDSQTGGAPEQPESEHIVAGFRANGAFSVYFGDALVFQFNAAVELRRAFCDGLLLKASRGHLISVRRHRMESEVQLLTHALSESEEAAFLKRMSEHLINLSRRLNAGSFEVVGQVPPNSDVLERVRAWLAAHHEMRIASRPNA